jgi:PST family polysaccharide transporter
MALRVIIWPIGFIILAKGAMKLFFWTEVAWTAVHVGLVTVCVRAFGLNGAGMAFFGSYVASGFLVYAIVRRLTGFQWSAANRKTGLLFLCSIAIVFGGLQVLPRVPATILGVVVCAAASAYSLRILLQLIPTHRIPSPARALFTRLRLMPAAGPSAAATDAAATDATTTDAAVTGAAATDAGQPTPAPGPLPL